MTMQDEAKAALLKEAENFYRAGAFLPARGKWQEVLKDEPAHLDALAGFVNASLQMSDAAESVRVAALAHEAAPDDVRILNLYLDTLISNQEQQTAFEIACAGTERFPDNTNLHVKVAQCRMGFGEIDKARGELWTAHENDPKAVNPLYFLVRIGDRRDFEKLEVPVENAYVQRESIEPSEQVMIAYTRAALAEKLGRYDDAWDAYKVGNGIQLQMAIFDEAGYVETINNNIKLFGQKMPPPLDENAPGHNIIFIVSLPRSGSTLTEQILGSHSRVWPIGERKLVLESFSLWEKSPNTEGLEEARRHYLEGAREIAACSDDERAFIADKSINTYFFVGFLRMLLPGAKFVHVVRAPLDAAVSCYATPFALNSLKWCSDLETIGRVFRRYQKIMKVWMRAGRGDLLTISYEDLTADPETKVRELIKFCGLDWEPACLAFHENKRQVSTASLVQVRQPIYQSAKGRATHFDKYLDPLKRAMGRAASPDWYK